MFNEYPDVLTVEKLAEALGIGKNKAYELINNRVIGSKRIGRKIVIPKCCLIDYLQSSRYNIRA
ncbi:MAG: DNA-binding protein [Clostridia bacterium]|nr:DNA-binding protein [Clostridia bacterium]